MHFFHILTNQGILFTVAYPAADAQFFSLVKLNETSGVVLANVCIRMRNNTPELLVAQNFHSTGRGWLYAVEPTSNRSSVN